MPTPLNPGPSSAPPPFDSEATKFSAANAFRLSLLANAAYLNQPDAKSLANDLGLPQFEWIDLSEQFRDLYGFAAGCDDYAVLAFRGTDNLKDWMTNLQCRAGPLFMVFRRRKGSRRSAFGLHTGGAAFMGGDCKRGR